MKKIVKHIETMERILEAQKAEIIKLRFMVARYHAMHGEQIKGGTYDVFDEDDFVIRGSDENTVCKRINTTKLGITNNYQDIQRMLAELE